MSGLDLNNPAISDLLKNVKQLMMGPQVQGLNGQALTGLSDEEVKATYAQACQMLKAKQIGPAAKLFGMLTAIKPGESKHWRGLALCAQKKDGWQAAVFLYQMALQQNEDDVISRVFLSEALLKLRHNGAARAVCQRAIEDGERLVSTERHLDSYLKRAKKLLQFINGADNAEQTFERS